MLLEPFKFRNGVLARSRTWLAPMTNQQSADDGTVSDVELRWLEMRAKGGFAVVETCAAHISTDGQGFPGAIGVHDDRLLPGLKRLASTIGGMVRSESSSSFTGECGHRPSLTGQQPWSATACAVPGGEMSREGTAADITRAIERFRDAAVRAHAAGFAGIELHAAHGYLLGQFLSATINTRTDLWGGSLEGRARFLRQTVRTIRAAVPGHFLVGARLSPEDFGNAQGLDLDESLEVARWLCEDGVDFIHLSLWNARRVIPASDRKSIPSRSSASAVGSEVPVIVAGGIWSRDDAEALLEKGATAVAIGRAAILNPDWPARSAEPAWEPRRPPMTVAELGERGVSERFAGYLRNWKGFVADAPAERLSRLRDRLLTITMSVPHASDEAGGERRAEWRSDGAAHLCGWAQLDRSVAIDTTPGLVELEEGEAQILRALRPPRAAVARLHRLRSARPAQLRSLSG